MSTLNRNFLTRDGEPITGRTPTQVLVYGDRMALTGDLQAAVEAAYRKFYNAVRLSPAANGYHVQTRVLSDGTKVRMESNSGLERIMVWPAGSEEEGNLKTFFCIPYDFDNQDAKDTYFIKRWPDASKVSPTSILDELRKDKERKPFLGDDIDGAAIEGKAHPGNTTWYARTSQKHKHKDIVVSWWGRPCRYGSTDLTEINHAVAPDYHPVPTAPAHVWLNGNRIGIKFEEGSDEAINSACVGTRTTNAVPTSVLRVLSGKNNTDNVCRVPYRVYEIPLKAAIEKAVAGGLVETADLATYEVTGLPAAIGVAGADSFLRVIQPSYWNADGSECLGIYEVDYGDSVDDFTRYGTVVVKIEARDMATDEPRAVTPTTYAKSEYSESLSVTSSASGTAPLDAFARRDAAITLYGFNTGLDLDPVYSAGKYASPVDPGEGNRVVADYFARTTSRDCSATTSVTSSHVLAVDYNGNTPVVIKYKYTESFTSTYSSDFITSETVVDEGFVPSGDSYDFTTTGVLTTVENYQAARVVNTSSSGKLYNGDSVIADSECQITITGNAELGITGTSTKARHDTVVYQSSNTDSRNATGISTTSTVAAYDVSAIGCSNFYHLVAGDLRTGVALFYAEPMGMRGATMEGLSPGYGPYPDEALSISVGRPENAAFLTDKGMWTKSTIEDYLFHGGMEGTFHTGVSHVETRTATDNFSRYHVYNTNPVLDEVDEYFYDGIIKARSASVQNDLHTAGNTYEIIRMVDYITSVAKETRIAKPKFRSITDAVFTIPTDYNYSFTDSNEATYAYVVVDGRPASPPLPASFPKTDRTQVNIYYSMYGGSAQELFYTQFYGWINAAVVVKSATRDVVTDAQIGTDVSRPNGTDEPFGAVTIDQGYCPYGYSASASSPDAKQTYMAFTSKEAADINSAGITDTMTRVNVDRWIVDGKVVTPTKEYPYAGEYKMLSSPVFVGPLPQEKTRTFP